MSSSAGRSSEALYGPEHINLGTHHSHITLEQSTSGANTFLFQQALIRAAISFTGGPEMSRRAMGGIPHG